MRPIITPQLVNGPFGDPVLYAEIMFERRALLFDIGDISALPPRKLLRVSHVFVSHAHMDHFSGFDHLLRLLLGRDRSVALFGPPGFCDRVEHKLRAYTWNLLRSYAGNLAFDVTEVGDDATLHRARFESREEFRRESLPSADMQDDRLAACGALTVRCALLDHGTPCLGFALEEPAHVNIWKTRLDAMGLAVGPWLRDLKRALLADAPASTPMQALRRDDAGVAAVTLPLAALRDVASVGHGQKIGYVVDVRHHAENAERITRLVRGADLLFVECAFLDADRAHAARKNHLTARQAGLLARRAQVGRLIPCHISTRYAGAGEEVAEEAQRAFRGDSESDSLAAISAVAVASSPAPPSSGAT
jgi:ribonuclease Z